MRKFTIASACVTAISVGLLVTMARAGTLIRIDDPFEIGGPSVTIGPTSGGTGTPPAFITSPSVTDESIDFILHSYAPLVGVPFTGEPADYVLLEPPSEPG